MAVDVSTDDRGHYYTPTSDEDGTCEAAVVVGVNEPIDHAEPTVNLTAWRAEGGETTRGGVPVGLPGPLFAEPDKEGHDIVNVSFHLSGDCPWHRVFDY